MATKLRMGTDTNLFTIMDTHFKTIGACIKNTPIVFFPIIFRIGNPSLVCKNNRKTAIKYKY
jgi:hypothetical protein